MAPPLSTEQILRDKKTSDPNSITSLSLTHKALSNVSYLSDFKNLERLDLTFNNLTSLQGLESCVNLKWLNVQQNKLQSLKGIESLTNLSVFNAGKNELRSMDEVKDLVKLRALILNDNEISTISGLDKLTELNTLVLSRNPIYKMGDSLAKLKSIEKVSLSNCQLEAIDSSVKACTQLQQLRLAHNDIKTLPAELASNKKLQILDVGNNMISRWSDLEALSSLRNLKNLNLLGNPIAEKAKLLKKVNKLAPSLQIFNAKRMDQLNPIKKNQKVEYAVASMADDLEPLKKQRKDRIEKHVPWDDKRMDKKVLKEEGEKGRGLHDDGKNMSTEKSGKNLKVDVRSTYVTNGKEYQQEGTRDPMKKSKKTITSQKEERDLDVAGSELEDELKKPKKKKEKLVEKDLLLQETDRTSDKRSKRKAEKAGIDVIDDKETPFAELFAYNPPEDVKSNDGEGRYSQAVGNTDSYPSKKKKSKNQGAGASVFEFLKPAPEVGLGGPSAWDTSD